MWNVTALTTAAVAVAWYAVQEKRPWLVGMAVTVAAAKPTNIWLALGLVLVPVLLRWPWKEKLKAGTIPALAVAISFPISGWAWPRRYLLFIQAHPPNAGYNASFLALKGPVPIAMWIVAALAAVIALALALQRKGVNGIAVAVGLVLNLLISPYQTIYHWVAAIPAMSWLGRRDSLWLVLLYAASVAWMIVRPPAGVYPIFPLALAVSLVVALWKDRVTTGS